MSLDSRTHEVYRRSILGPASLLLASLAFVCWVVLSRPAAGPSPVDAWLVHASPVLDDAEGSLNPYVLKVIDAFPKDGSYPYRWKLKPPEYDIYNGVSQDVVYQGKVVAKGHPNGTRCSNCCGLTFEVFCRAMRLRNVRKGLPSDDFNGMSGDDLFNLMLIWFIVAPKDCPQKAIEWYGLGRKIENWDEAKPGDFGDLSRNNDSGHSVIFMGWERDAFRKTVGIRYFSSNSHTGVGFQTERFSDTGGKVLRDLIHLGRVGRIEDYRRLDRAAIPARHP